MEQAGGHIPTSSWFKPMSVGNISDFIVAFAKIFQAFQGFLFCRSWVDSEESKRKVSSMIIHLGREVISFRFPILSGKSGMFFPVMYMVRKSALIVEKFRIHWPSPILIPNPFSNQSTLKS